MPHSLLTKQAFAQAIRDLLETTPFVKISVGQICERCQMNRKSFYYHFKDKYDLVNWIFYREIVSVLQARPRFTPWEFVTDLCVYFDDNRAFYCKVLKVEGQNSFSEYFREVLEPFIHTFLYGVLQDMPASPFFQELFTDAIYSALTRWLTYPEPIPAETFIALLRTSLGQLSRWVLREETREEALPAT